jgi:hypothetical protein
MSFWLVMLHKRRTVRFKYRVESSRLREDKYEWTDFEKHIVTSLILGSFLFEVVAGMSIASASNINAASRMANAYQHAEEAPGQGKALLQMSNTLLNESMDLVQSNKADRDVQVRLLMLLEQII